MQAASFMSDGAQCKRDPERLQDNSGLAASVAWQARHWTRQVKTGWCRRVRKHKAFIGALAAAGV